MSEHDVTLDVVRALWAVHHALERASERMEARIGITATQRIVIRTLGRYPGMMPGQLAEALGVHPGTTSGQLRRLEARGLITRLRDPRDARRVMLGLTEAGRAYDRPMEGTVEQAVQTAIASVDPRRIEATVEVLQEICRSLGGVATRGTEKKVAGDVAVARGGRKKRREGPGGT